MIRGEWTRGALPMIAALVLGVGASGTIFGILRHFEYFRAESQFRQLAEQRLSTVRTRVAGALDTINLVAGHFAVSQYTSRREFSMLAAPALESHHYLQALEWIPRVEHRARASYERLARLDGIPGFQFKERQKDGTMGAAGERAEYFPVLYAEPRAGNERALGFDLGSNPVRLAALKKARETGRIVATARVLLVQERGDQYGVLIFAPVYSQPEVNSAGGQTKDLKGFALAVLRVGDLIATAIDRQRGLGGVEIHVFDVDASGSGQQIYPRTPEISAEALRSGLHVEERLIGDGTAWALVATPSGGSADLSSPAGPFLVLAFGLLVTAVFVLHLSARNRQSDHIAQVAEELRLANQRLEIHTAEMAEQGHLAALGAEIGVALTQRDGLDIMLQRCAGVLVKHLGAAFARIWTLSEDQNVLELEASAGIYTHINGGHARVPMGSFKIGRIAQDRRPHLTNSVIGDPEVSDQAWAKREGMVAFAGYPLIVEDRLVGVVAVFAHKPLADSVLKTLASIADEIALGIERKRAEEALRASETRFRIAAENGSDVILVRSLLTNQVHSSGAAERLLPCAKKMPQSYDEFTRLLYPDDRDRVVSAIQAHLQTGMPYREEFRVVDQDGTIRHWTGRGASVRNALGQATEFIVVNTDITAQKQAEAALSHLAAIVDSSEASILSIDMQGTILSWNPAAERIYGYSAEEIKGRSIALIYPADRHYELGDLLQKMQRGEGARHIETIRVRKDGQTIPIFVTYSPLRDASGSVVGACSIATDIRERKLLERQLSQAQKLESIGQLAAGIAHEINTPIQYVGDNIRFLRDSFARLEQLLAGYDRLLESVRSQSPDAPFLADIEALAKAVRVSYLR
ncbi:MAG TPA: CHASE domain-containing protein, partial [Bryobacteraceae bacterium]|nr:CHASE domain-containing protein [Bryobacteraceae bacterium]